MSFRNPNIFQFPTVQYIPLTLTTILQGKLPKHNSSLPKPLLLAGRTVIKDWSIALLRDYGLVLPELIREDEIVPILLLQAEANEVNYRGYNVVLTGNPKPGYYILSSITKKYFYKPKLFFELYDSQSGKQLANFSTFFGSHQSLSL